MSQPAPFSTNDFTVSPVAHASTLPAPPPSDPDHDTEESTADIAARIPAILRTEAGRDAFNRAVPLFTADRQFSGVVLPGRPARDAIQPTDSNLRAADEG